MGNVHHLDVNDPGHTNEYARYYTVNMIGTVIKDTRSHNPPSIETTEQPRCRLHKGIANRVGFLKSDLESLSLMPKHLVDTSPIKSKANSRRRNCEAGVLKKDEYG